MESNKPMNPTESLELISTMISSSRRKMARNSYRPFLIWGYTTLVVTLIELGLHVLNPPTVSSSLRLFVWWSIPVIGVLLTYIFRERGTQTKSPLDVNIGAVWAIISFAMIPMFTMFLISSAFYLVLPMILLLMGMGAMITGVMARLKVVSLGGFVSMVGAVLICALALWFKKTMEGTTTVEARGELVELFLTGQLVIFALSFVGTMIVPGHYMKRMFNQPEEK